MRFLKFDDFSRLYEAEEQGQLSEDAKDILLQIGVLFFNAYGYALALTKDYKDTLADFQTIIGANPDAKAAEMKKVAAKVAGQVREEFKKEGVEKLWQTAADLSSDALDALMTQFKDNKELQDAASALLNKKITGYIAQLKTSKEEIKPVEPKKESEAFDFDEQLYEGFFTTKRGSVNNLIKQAVVVDSLLKAESENKDITADVQKLQSELDGILANLAKLSKAKKGDIDESELDKIAERLTQMPFDLNKKKEALAKTNKSFSEASTLFVKALNAANRAIAKEKEVKDKLAAEAAANKEKEGGDKKVGAIKIGKNVSKSSVAGKEDETVKKFQQLVIDKFKDNKDVNETELFKKFIKFGADGKFGGTTAGIIVSLKAGFGLDDTSTDITQELIDEVSAMKPAEKSNESENFVIRNFDSFASVYEAFDAAKFKTASTGAAVAPRAVDPRPVAVKKEVAEVPAPEQLAKAIEDAAKKIVDEKDKKDLIAALVAMGATEITDKPADNAIAYTKTFRFYPNLRFYRPLTGKTGSIPKDLSKGIDTEFTDESGAKTTFKKEEGLYPSYLQTIRKQLTQDVHGGGTRNKKLYTDILPKLSKREMLTIAKIWKNMYGETLLKQLDDEWTNTAEIREFTRKFADNLK